MVSLNDRRCWIVESKCRPMRAIDLIPSLSGTVSIICACGQTLPCDVDMSGRRITITAPCPCWAEVEDTDG